MALKTWTGAADDGSWGTPGNWSPSAPVADDQVVVPIVDVSTGNKHITAGLDQSALTIADLTIAKGSPVNIGGLGTPLRIGTTRVLHLGDGAVYFKSERTSVSKNPYIGVASKNMALAMHIDCVAGDSPVRIDIGAGRVVLAGTADLTPTRVHLSYQRSRDTDAECVITSGCGAITELLQSGGRMICNHAGTITRLVQNAGYFEWNTGTITDPLIAGGTCVVNVVSTIAALRVLGGIADCTRSAAIKTITAAYVQKPGDLLWRPNWDSIGNLTTAGDPFYGVAQQEQGLLIGSVR